MVFIKKEPKYSDKIVCLRMCRSRAEIWAEKKRKAPELGKKKQSSTGVFYVYSAGQLKYRKAWINWVWGEAGWERGERGSSWPVDHFSFHFPNRMVTQQATKKKSRTITSQCVKTMVRLHPPNHGAFPLSRLKIAHPGANLLSQVFAQELKSGAINK